MRSTRWDRQRENIYPHFSIRQDIKLPFTLLMRNLIEKRAGGAETLNPFSFRPMVERSNITDSKSVDPGFESQSGDLTDEVAKNWFYRLDFAAV